jgi:predicted ATPase/transcriptional regulator with XRE-family HTH domain
MQAGGRAHFGALLKQFRLDAGMTQQNLAERAKLSVEAISTLERGARTRPQRETVGLLALALELTPEREELLRSAIDSSRKPERGDVLNASLLHLVRLDAQATPRNNLPQRLTSFVGRQDEVGEIATLLREHRLVTVLGAGGVGKTRVAVQLGSDLLEAFPDGVWLVDLAPLADETLVPSAVLNTLQLPCTTGSALDLVVAYLKTCRLLLLLDNCEHVIAGARDVAYSIAQSCPGVCILSTSREILNVPFEWVYRLPSLAVPSTALPSARDVLSFGAVALFVDRALAVDAGFVLTDNNAPDVAEITRRLDGIPLAIELAAARVKALAPHQIAQRLDQRFRLLTNGHARALPRHQTMSAVIDWSYDLLTSREQKLFAWLSVFAGGCTLEAVAAVCATDGEDDLAVIDLLESLVSKSLLVAELASRAQRYRLLESSQRYAWDKLVASGEQDEVARRHALFCVELAERLEPARDTAHEPTWLSLATVEVGNWRAALEWTLAKRADIILGQRLASSRSVILRSFTLPEARRWVRLALELLAERTPPDVVARLEHADASGAEQFGERKVSLAAAERALVRYRALGDTLGSARAQILVGAALVGLGRPAEAEPPLREALEAARSLGNHRLEVDVLQKIGWARSGVGDFAGSRAQLSEALELAKVVGAESFLTPLALNLALNEFNAGAPEAALRLTVDLLATRALDSRNMTNALVNMAAYLIELGRYDEARERASEGLEVARGRRDDVYVAIALHHLALIAMKPQVEGARTSAEYAGTVRLLGFVGARRDTLGIEAIGLEYDRALAVLRDAIGADELARLMATGATMTEDEAIAQAQALE